MKRYFIIGTISSLITLSCSSELETYHGTSGIYFAMNAGSTAVNADTMYSETSLLPFIVTEDVDSTFNLKVKILGAVSDKDRQISIETVPEETDALEEDYDLTSYSHILPAGSVQLILPGDTHIVACAKGSPEVRIYNCNVNSEEMLKVLYFSSAGYDFPLDDCVQTAKMAPDHHWRHLLDLARETCGMRDDGTPLKNSQGARPRSKNFSGTGAAITQPTSSNPCGADSARRFISTVRTGALSRTCPTTHSSNCAVIST